MFSIIFCIFILVLKSPITYIYHLCRKTQTLRIVPICTSPPRARKVLEAARATMVKDKLLGAHRAVNRKSGVYMRNRLRIPVRVRLPLASLVQDCSESELELHNTNTRVLSTWSLRHLKQIV